MKGMGTKSSAIARQKPKDAFWQASFEKPAKEHTDGAAVAYDLHETLLKYGHTIDTIHSHQRLEGRGPPCPWGGGQIR